MIINTLSVTGVRYGIAAKNITNPEVLPRRKYLLMIQGSCLMKTNYF